MNSQFQKELRELEAGENIYEDFSFYETDVVGQFETILTGPRRTVFEGAAYNLAIVVPLNYPEEQPTITFYGVIPWHPNIDEDNGSICIEMLNNWNKKYTVINALHCIQTLLVLPNPDSCLNGEAGNIFKTNQPEYERRVKENVERSRVQF